ncbi:MAG: cation transporter [Bacillota bacterium]
MPRHDVDIAAQKERTLRAAWLISLTAPLATAAAFLLGRSAVQLADFLRRTAELLALFLAWYILRKVAGGQQNGRQYVRLENLSSLITAAVMFISFALVTYSSVSRFLHPVPLGWVAPGLVIPIGGVMVNGWFWRRGSLLARAESTPIIESQWRLCRSKTILDACVFITLLLALILGDSPWAQRSDLIGSLVIGVFLLVSSCRIGRGAVEDLLDRNPPESSATD